MRIVGGALSGRRFEGPRGEVTRPTSERVREAIASAIESRGGFEGTRVLDLFAGTGAMLFEALSRGAILGVAIDRDSRMVRAMTESARELGLADRARIARAELGEKGAARAIAAIDAGPFDRVFLDPPYADAELTTAIVAELVAAELLAPGALVCVEHARRHAPARLDALTQVSDRRYGDTCVVIYQLDPTLGGGPR